MAQLRKLSKKQVVADIDGVQHVLLGRLCREAGVPYNHGLDVAQKHAAKVGRKKEVINLGRSTTQCVVMPMDSLPIWMGLLNPAAISDIRVSTELSAYQSRYAKGDALPYPNFIISALFPVKKTASKESTTEKTTPAEEKLLTPSKEFCEAVDKCKPSRQSPMVKMAMRLEEAENLLEKSRYAARLQEQEVSRIKREMAKALGVCEDDAFCTIADFCAKRRISIDSDKASALGRVATGYCKAREIQTGTAPHPFYKSVKTYPVEAIEYALDQQGGAS